MQVSFPDPPTVIGRVVVIPFQIISMCLIGLMCLVAWIVALPFAGIWALVEVIVDSCHEKEST